LSSRETIISLIFDSRFDLSVKNSLSAQKASLLLSVLNVPALILEKPQSKKSLKVFIGHYFIIK